MVTCGINRGNGSIKSKREEIFASMKGDRQSTYSVYNEYKRDSYINNKRAKIFADMKPENIEIAKETKEDSSALNYLKRSGKQVILGNYTKDVTLLGTVGQIGAGLLDLDLPMDLRDIAYDFTNWEWSWGHAGQTFLDLVGVLPIVGAIKYGDEVGTLVKTSIKNLDTAGDIAKKTEAISDVAKGTENVSDITKEMDKVSEAVAKGGTKAEKTFNEGDLIDKELLLQKPRNSPNLPKWLDNGGGISIDADGVWTYIHPDGHSVKYIDGFPDFKSAGLVKQEVDIGGFNNCYDDFNKADELAPNGPRDAINNTWHHNQDGKTMQGVNKEIHKDYTHRGGMSINKKK